MARDARSFSLPGVPAQLLTLLISPWVLVIAGFLCAVGAVLVEGLAEHARAELVKQGASLEEALLVEDVEGSGWALVRLLAMALSLVLCVLAVGRRLRSASWDFPTRAETAGLLGLAGMAAVSCWYGMGPAWTSGRIFFGGLALVALGGALLVLLPWQVRRFALSLLVLFHFGGMLTAITSVDPPGTTGPWVSKELWGRVYRPYLSALYMTNAYHFYSPEPGPPSLLWFAVHYDDGTWTWVKLPDRANSPVGMHYQRMLALPEHTFFPLPPMTRAQLDQLEKTTGVRSNREPWEIVYTRRLKGSSLPYKPPIPYPQDIDASAQYREPADTHKRMLAGLARHVFWHAPKPLKPDARVSSVKLYRVTQQLVSPQELVQGKDPLDKDRYLPFFMGEFDGKGRLIEPREPFLYWYVPIVKVPPGYPVGCFNSQLDTYAINANSPPPGSQLVDFLEIHAAGRHRREAQEQKKP